MQGRVIGMILMGGVVLAATSASAQTYDPKYPICMKLTEWGGEHIDCSFTSIAQCNGTASGRPAQCIDNPYFGYSRRR